MADGGVDRDDRRRRIRAVWEHDCESNFSSSAHAHRDDHRITPADNHPAPHTDIDKTPHCYILP